MNVLLDICALIALSNETLPPAAATRLGQAVEAYVSPVSAWEVGIKHKAGKLQLSQPSLSWFRAVCERYHLTEWPLHTDILCAAADLPLIHRDPFDRVLIATAHLRPMVILTSDQIIPTYPNINTLW